MFLLYFVSQVVVQNKRILSKSPLYLQVSPGLEFCLFVSLFYNNKNVGLLWPNLIC